MKNQDLINALRNEGRQPVDLNLGQVPVSPTIGRMGNYNVVVPGYSNRNSATELSSALAQMPQLLGQARNIQETAGKQAANELTTEQVIDRLKKGDLEAQGFLTQFGKDKAFAEQVYQRWFDSTIKASIINASSQIDNKSPEELLEMGEGDVFTENARNLLVSSITGGDQDLLKKIAANPHTARLHNKAMEGVIPEFTAKAAATAEARKQKFARDSALSNVGADILSGTDVEVREFVKDETKSDIQNKIDAEKFRTNALNVYVENMQEVINNALMNPALSVEDRDEAVKIAVSAVRSRMALLLEQEDLDEYAALLSAMQDGSLTINERPFEQSPEGIKQLIYAESALEEYEDKLARENERGDFDRNKIDGVKVNIMRPITERIYADENATPSAFQNGIDKLNDLRLEIMDENGAYRADFSNTEIEHLLDTVGDKITSLEQARNGRLSTTMLMKASSEYDKLQIQTGLGLPELVKRQRDPSVRTLRERAEEFGLTEEMNSLIEQVTDTNTQRISEIPVGPLFTVPGEAHEDAMAIALERPFQDLQDGKLDLSPEKMNEIVETYEKEYQRIYTNRVKEVADANGFIKGAAVDPNAAQDALSSPEENEQGVLDRLQDSGYPLQDGRIKYERGRRRPSLPATASHSLGVARDQSGFEPAVDTLNAWKMVNDEEAVKIFRTNNLETERLEFVKTWLATKYSKAAKHERAEAIMKKPQPKQTQSKIWEIQQSRSTGLPMEILRTNKGISESHYFKENTDFSRFFGVKGDRRSFSINYGFKGELTNKDAPEKRIFNVNAVYKAVRKNDFEDLIFIATEYGHAPKGASVNSKEIQSFLNKQKVLINKYGFMDFRPRETRKPFEPPKERTLEDYEELYKNSAITDPPKEEGAPPVSETVAPNLKENEESVEAKITAIQGESGISVYSPQKGGENGGDKMEGGYPSSKPGPDGKFLVRTVQEYAEGKHDYITLAGSPAFYNKEYVIPALPYKDPKTGEKKIFNNVRAIVHDTGEMFTTAPEFRFDIPLGKDLKRKQMEDYELLLKQDGISYIPAVEPREGGPVDQPVEQPVDSK